LALLEKPEPAPARAAKDSDRIAADITPPTALARKMTAEAAQAPVQVDQAPARQTLARTAQARSIIAPEPAPSVSRPAANAIQYEERSIASLPEDISEPKIRVYSLADLPAAPVLRADTRFARIQAHSSSNVVGPEPASPEVVLTTKSEAHDIDSRTSRLRPPVPYGQELLVEVEPEDREETAEQIVLTAKRLGGIVERVDRVVPEGTVAVRVLMPERTAYMFIDELRRNGNLPPEAMPERNIRPAGPKPGTVAYTLRLHSH
jgi:hypothetical protein